MARLSVKQEAKAFIVGLFMWIPLSVMFVPYFVTCFIVSVIVHTVAAFTRPDLRPLSKIDSLFSFSPSNTSYSNAYTCQIWKLKGRIELEAFRNHFYNCFLSTPEDREKYFNLHCYFVEYLGYIFKKPVVTIDLEYHIQELNLKRAGFDSVESFVGQWMVAPDIDTKLNIERPIWMVKIIHDKKENQERSTVIFKLHHGLCDGYTIVHLVDKLSGQHAPYLFKDPEPSLFEKLKLLAQFPYLVATLWKKMAKCENQFLSDALSMKGSEKIEQEDSHENWLISFCTLDLETVKQIRRVTKTHFVTVLMSVQVGALKRMMNELCGHNETELKRLKELYIGHSMGWPSHPVMTHGGGMTNHLTLTSIKASFELDDPLTRLIDLDQNFRQSKLEGYPVLLYYGGANILHFQPAFIARLMNESKFSLVGMETGLSSLLCSSNPHFLLEVPVQNLYLPVMVRSMFRNMKLVTVPVSHSGILDVSINASTALIKDQENFDRLTKVHFVQELEALRKRCQNLVE